MKFTIIFFAGNVSTFAGSGRKSTEDGIGVNASFNHPYGITMNQLNGDIYVCEHTDHSGHVRKISPQGTQAMKIVRAMYQIEADIFVKVYTIVYTNTFFVYLWTFCRPLKTFLKYTLTLLRSFWRTYK